MSSDWLWAAVAVYGIHRLAQVAEQFVPIKDAKTPATAAAAVEVPEDLVALALQENEVWAQEEILRVIRERYELYNDWNKVRAAMGLGRRD